MKFQCLKPCIDYACYSDMDDEEWERVKGMYVFDNSSLTEEFMLQEFENCNHLMVSIV